MATTDGYALPDDGIVDIVAVDIATAGHRIVRLTRTERLLATANIIDNAEPDTTDVELRHIIQARLGLPGGSRGYKQAVRLVENIRQHGRPQIQSKRVSPAEYRLAA